MRSLLFITAALVGAILIGADARWLEGAELEFSCSLFGHPLWRGTREQLLIAVTRFSPAAYVTAAVLAVVLGLTAARSFRKGAWLVGLAFAVLLFAAFDPGSLLFVALRRTTSATRYLDVGDLARSIGWGALACACFGWLRRKQPNPDAELESLALTKQSRVVFLSCLLAGLLPLLFSFGFLGGEPVTNDGVAYRFQAELFARAELSRDVGSFSDFFPARQLYPGSQTFSKYPPGHSALLAIGDLVGFQRLLPFLLACLVPWLTWLIARRLKLEHAHRAALLVAVCPALVGVQSLWLSHATSVPMCLIFCYAVLRALDELETNRNRAMLFGIVAGLAISIAFSARPLTAIAFALPFVLFVVWQRKPGTLAVSSLACLGFLPVAAGFLFVNHQLTGSPFKTAYGLYAEVVSPNDRYGFVNLGTALEYTRFNLARLCSWTLGFVPGLWLAVLGATSSLRPRRTSLLWLPALSLILFYSLHRFHGIPWVGPLYLVEAMPCLAILTAAGCNRLERHFGANIWRLCFVVVCLSSGHLLYNHFVTAEAEVGARRMPYRLAAKQSIQRGVIFVPLETEGAFRRFPLPASDPSKALIFARDLGSRNAELLRVLKDPPAWIYDSTRLKLVPVSR
ncbi:MAG: hypothetical protein ACI8TQ_001129 [Planctomycetota bacterium]|jgi:hypothetical protein